MVTGDSLCKLAGNVCRADPATATTAGDSVQITAAGADRPRHFLFPCQISETWQAFERRVIACIPSAVASSHDGYTHRLAGPGQSV